MSLSNNLLQIQIWFLYFLQDVSHISSMKEKRSARYHGVQIHGIYHILFRYYALQVED